MPTSKLTKEEAALTVNLGGPVKGSARGTDVELTPEEAALVVNMEEPARAQPPATPQQQMAPQPQAPVPDVVDRFLRGVKDMGAGAVQSGLMAKDPYMAVIGGGEDYQSNVPGFTQHVNEEVADYERSLGDDAPYTPFGLDAPRIAGQASMWAPLGFGAGRAVIEGVASGLSQFSPTGTWQEKAVQGAVGGALGPVADKAVRSAGGAAANLTQRFLGSLAGKVRAFGVTDPSTLAREALKEVGISLDALDAESQRHFIALTQRQLQVDGRVSAPELAREQNFEELNFPRTSAMVTRDPVEWGRERNLAKLEGTGQPLMDRFRAGQLRLHDLIDEFKGLVTGGKGVTDDAYGLGRDSVDHIQGRARRMQDDVGVKYDDAAAAEGADIPMPRELLRERVASSSSADGFIDTWEDVVPGAVMKRVQELANPDSARPFSIQEVEKLRKLANELMGDDRKLRKPLGQLSRILDDAVRAADAESAAAKLAADARAAASERFKVLAPVKDVVDGRVSPDDFVKKYVIGAKVDALDALKDFLRQGSEAERARGAEIWEQMRGHVADHLNDAATRGKGRDSMFSGDALRKALGKINDRRLRILFDDSEVATLRKIASAAFDSTAEPPFSTTNYSGSAPTAFNLVRMALKMPGVGPALDTWQKRAEQDVQERMVGRALHGSRQAPDADLVAAQQEQLVKKLRLKDAPGVGGVPAAVFDDARGEDPDAP